MSRLRCLGFCACLALSLTAMACGSSNSGSSSGWDAARIGNTATAWWINAHKGAYYFSFQIEPSYQDDTAGKAQAISFAQQVVAKVGSNTAAPATLVPALSELPGWVLDPGESKTVGGVATATDFAGATALIDGAADPFFDSTKSYHATALAWERWAKDPYTMDLKVWQMASAADATTIYTDLLSNSLYANVTWTTCTATACP